jgi:hypothetical protein
VTVLWDTKRSGDLSTLTLTSQPLSNLRRGGMGPRSDCMAQPPQNVGLKCRLSPLCPWLHKVPR